MGAMGSCQGGGGGWAARVVEVRFIARGDVCAPPHRVPSGRASTGSGRTDLRMALAKGCVGLGARVSQSWAVVGRPPPLPRGSCGPPLTLRFPSGRTASLAPPLWIPAFAGMTVGGLIAGMGGWWRRGEFPLLRDGRFANRPYDGGG